MTKSQKIVYIVLSLACLVIGGGIYLIYRPRHLVLFNFVPQGCIDYFDNICRSNDITLTHIGQFIVYNLPTFLWTSSYLIIMHVICRDVYGRQRLLFIYALPIVLLICEFLQLFHFIPGTFDIIDLFTYVIPICISLIVDKYEKV